METWFWVLGWFLSILTMVANGFVIFLVCSKRQLRTKTNAFVMSLAVADFGVGMIAVPSHFFCSLATECTPPLKEGIIVIFVRVLILYSSGTNLVILVLERYVKKEFSGNAVLGSRLVTTECILCFEILDFNLQQNLLWSIVLLFFLYTIEADLYFGVRNIWSLKI